jgi:plastocyanin
LRAVAVDGLVEHFDTRERTIEVPIGTEVVWSNGDAIEHTVTSGPPDSANGVFAGRMADSGATFSHVFDRLGTFGYFCDRHHFMRGQVRVVPLTHGES